MPFLGYSALTKPRLWPNDTLQEARLECTRSLKDKRLGPTKRAELTALLEGAETILRERGQRLRVDHFAKC